MTRRLLVHLRDRVDALPADDPVRLDLESELIILMVAEAQASRARARAQARRSISYSMDGGRFLTS